MQWSQKKQRSNTANKRVAIHHLKSDGHDIAYGIAVNIFVVSVVRF